MIAEDLMTRNIKSVEPSTPVVVAANLMLANHISGLPVLTQQGRLVGIVSEGDLLRRRELGTEIKRSWWMDILASHGRLAEEFTHANGRLVEEVMTQQVVTISRETTLVDIVSLMDAHTIKRLPVVEKGQLVGIVSRADILRALLRTLSAQPAPGADDERIRTSLLHQLARQPWSASQYFQVRVLKGIVELSGTVFDAREKHAARVLAENMPGVKAVKDNVDIVEPFSGALISPQRNEPGDNRA
jgi:CBS domain-containing protein